MRRPRIAAGLVLACAAAAFGDYVADREAAVKLVNDRRYEKAIENLEGAAE